jgi:hypothetical protein
MTDSDSDALLQHGQALGWPRLQVMPGVAIPAGVAAWQSFVCFATPERLRQAVRAAASYEVREAAPSADARG